MPEGVAHAARRNGSLHAVQLIRVTHASARRLALCAAGGGLVSQQGRVHRDQTSHPRSSGCPLPSVPATGSRRAAERRKKAR